MSTRCYSIDGAPYPSFSDYIPCNTTAAAIGAHTSCCAPGDNCLSNGFCQSQGDSDRKSNLFWRDGCTDPTWTDPACPRVCEGLGKPYTHPVFYCLKQSSWCCPTGTFDGSQVLNTTCCTRADLTFSAPDPSIYTIAQVDVISSTSRTSASPTSTGSSRASIGSTSVTASARPSNETDSSLASTANSAGDDSIGVKVGVPLGIALAVALGVIVWLLIRLRKVTKGKEYVYEAPGGEYTEHKTEEYAHTHAHGDGNGVGIQPRELPSEGRVEMGNGR